jgi:hypothetical protein
MNFFVETVNKKIINRNKVGEPGMGRGTGAQRGSTFIYFSMVLTQAAVDTTTSEFPANCCRFVSTISSHFLFGVQLSLRLLGFVTRFGDFPLNVSILQLLIAYKLECV